MSGRGGTAPGGLVAGLALVVTVGLLVGVAAFLVGLGRGEAQAAALEREIGRLTTEAATARAAAQAARDSARAAGAVVVAQADTIARLRGSLRVARAAAGRIDTLYVAGDSVPYPVPVEVVRYIEKCDSLAKACAGAVRKADTAFALDAGADAKADSASAKKDDRKKGGGGLAAFLGGAAAAATACMLTR